MEDLTDIGVVQEDQHVLEIKVRQDGATPIHAQVISDNLSHMLCSSNHVDLLAPTGALVFIPACAIFLKSWWFKDINYDHHIIISLYHQT